MTKNPQACRLTYEGQRYLIEADGSVWTLAGPRGGELRVEQQSEAVAEAVKKDAARQRRNRSARFRASMLRDLGLKRTPYGWE